jgi:hypothetical protein
MIDESGFSSYAEGVELDAMCASSLAVAHAVYRMALPHFIDNDGGDRFAFSALEGALAEIEVLRDSALANFP